MTFLCLGNGVHGEECGFIKVKDKDSVSRKISKYFYKEEIFPMVVETTNTFFSTLDRLLVD